MLQVVSLLVASDQVRPSRRAPAQQEGQEELVARLAGAPAPEPELDARLMA